MHSTAVNIEKQIVYSSRQRSYSFMVRGSAARSILGLQLCTHAAALSYILALLILKFFFGRASLSWS